ncbi:CARDB domain-containing protein [Thermoplasma acidophilum]|uniref:CARDB domain-containing protein n=1 Tax=Thermoplasma acidophilum TaxID=2303 RepID=UPI0012EAC309|nr:CARDB domain-containing protein [Thermoplasma acidophilum]
MNKSTIAIAIVSIIALSSLAGLSFAKTPQTGYADIAVSYYGGPAKVPVEVLNFNGAVVASGSGPHLNVSLPFGQYYVYVPNYIGPGSSGNFTIYDAKSVAFNLTSSNVSVSIALTAYPTYGINVSFSGIPNGAIVKFETADDFVFNQTHVINGKYQFQLPIKVPFYAVLDYGTTNHTYLEYLANATSTLSISPNKPDFYGYPNVNSGNIVIIDPVSPYDYTVVPFTNGYFSINASSSDIILVESPGYMPYAFTSSQNGNMIKLSKDVSNVYYNYSLSQNMQTLYQNITFHLNNGTAFPNYFTNSSVGSLYWQMKLDNITESQLVRYFYGLAQNYTLSTFTVNGVNYNITSPPKVTVYSTSNSVTAYVNATYSNMSPVSSLSTINVYVYGTQNTPGSIQYNFNITYNNASLAVSSSNVPLISSYRYVRISPLSSNTMVSLKFSPVQKPVMANNSYTLYWKDMVSDNYVLNNNASNAYYVVPLNQTVYLNASSAYFNPVTNSNDYAQANFTWTINGTTEYSYNVSYKFYDQVNKVSVRVVSPSGGIAYSNFTVIGVSNSTAPMVKFSASLNGKTITSSKNYYRSNNTYLISLSVPQSASVSYSFYGSSLTAQKYSVFLMYSWHFPGQTFIGQNVSYAFQHPSIAPGYLNQYAYANITTEVGNVTHVILHVYVNDTTPPSATFFMMYNGTYIKNPIAGKSIVLSANNTTDPYYPFSDLRFQWKIEYVNGTVAQPSSTTYTNMTPMNNSYVIIQFNTVNSMIISLNVTNPSGISGYYNKTVSMVVQSPRLVVKSIYMPKAAYQGSSSKVYVNVSNLGTMNAYDVNITLYVNGKVVGSTTVSEIKAGSYYNATVTWVPPTSGKLPLYATAEVGNEPSAFVTAGALTQQVSVNPPAYRTPLIVVSVIVVLVVVVYVYYRIRSGGGKSTQKAVQPKTELPKQQQKKK